jgi:hypothetical protein
MGLAARRPDLGNGRIQPLAVGVDGGDASALPPDDVDRGATDAARRRRDECDLALEAHDLAPPLAVPSLVLSALPGTLHRAGRSSKGRLAGCAPDMRMLPLPSVERWR